VRVGLDARTLAAEQRSGVEHYVVNLVRAMAARTDAPEIIAYTDRPISDPGLAATVSRPPFSTRVIRAPRGWLQAALPWQLRRDRVQLAHFPSTVLPRLLPCPAVVTVHDLAWRRFPETYGKADLAMQERALTSALRAAHVLAVSETTARDLEVAGIPREQVTVTPLGVSPAFSPDGPRLAADAFPGAERLMSGYLLYGEGLRPRKNLLRLLEAYRALRVGQELSSCPTAAPPLVLAGAITAHARELQARARELGVAEQVMFPGYIAEDLLPVLCRSATAFVYPSLYEGFGLPVLEAMASGVPVVTSSTSATAEVADDAALLVDPQNTGEIASALARLLSDEGLRRDLAQRGLARSRQFTWERTAGGTIDVYGRVLGA